MKKEWTGNSKSVRIMNGDAHNPDRAAGDYYTTDPAAVREFLNKAFPKYSDGFRHHHTVWEPACGCGNISDVLKEYFECVISTDLYDRGYRCNYTKLCTGRDFKPVDFLHSDRISPSCDLIITNPPYSLSDEFILHALDILPESGMYIALLNINYLAGKKRFQHIYRNGYLQEVFVYTHRINCYKNNEPTGHSSPVNYAWFVFSKQKDYAHKKLSILGNDLKEPLIHWL